MKTRTGMALLVSITLALAMANASALPKAAEDIDAQVTTGADVARPKHLAKKPAAVQVQASKPGKPGKPAKPAAPRKGARTAR